MLFLGASSAHIKALDFSETIEKVEAAPRAQHRLLLHPALAQGHWAIQPENFSFSQPIARHFHLFKWAGYSPV